MAAKREIDTGLPGVGQPFSWAVAHGGHIYTSHGPVTPDGRILTGEIREQAQLTFDNLRQALAAAGASLEDVLQLTMYLVDSADVKPVDRLYAELFPRPYPSRATVIVAGLTVPGMRIELSAIAAVSDNSNV